VITPAPQLSDAQYDVFLSVGFGFCYSSALFPLVRFLDKWKTGELVGCSRRTKIIIMMRGFLTIVGLACLYGWYAFYLRGFYGSSLVPAHRLLLDWFSLGLFAVGANWWDNPDHREDFYCLIEALAVFAFGITCVTVLWRHQALDTQTMALVRAIFWCTVLFSCYLFFAWMVKCAGRVFDGQSQLNPRDQTTAIIRKAIIAFLILAVLDYCFLCWALNPVLFSWTINVQGLFGLTEQIVTGSIFLILHGVVGYYAIQIHDTSRRAVFRSILMTQLPMAVLILVTIFNYKYLFVDR
jgi:hypothetical protein